VDHLYQQMRPRRLNLIYGLIEKRTMGRTTISVDQAIADSLGGEADKQNKTLFGLANESLADVLKICEQGGSTKEIFSSWEFGRILKDTDSLPVPGALIEKIVKRMYSADSKWLLDAMFEAGVNIGSYLRLRFPNFEDLIPRLFDLQSFLPSKRVEFEAISTTTERMTISVRVLGAGPSLEATKCAEQFLAGLLSLYPYRITETRVTDGIIDAKITKEMTGDK
jgi:hypothetical protein